MEKMQKHSLIIIFPILCLTAFACSLFRPAETRFENEEISFDYPEGWKPLEYFWSTHELVYDKNFDAQEIAGIADSQSQSFQLKYSRSCKVMLKDLPPGESLGLHAEPPPGSQPCLALIVGSGERSTLGDRRKTEFAAYEKHTGHKHTADFNNGLSRSPSLCDGPRSGRVSSAASGFGQEDASPQHREREQNDEAHQDPAGGRSSGRAQGDQLLPGTAGASAGCGGSGRR